MTYDQLLAQLATIEKDPKATPQQSVAKHLLKMRDNNVIKAEDGVTVAPADDEDTTPAPIPVDTTPSTVDQDALVQGTQDITNPEPQPLQAVSLVKPDTEPLTPEQLKTLEGQKSGGFTPAPSNVALTSYQVPGTVGQGPALKQAPDYAAAANNGYPTGTVPPTDTLKPVQKTIAPNKNVRQGANASPNTALAAANNAAAAIEKANEQVAAGKQPILNTQVTAQTAENDQWAKDRATRAAQIQAAINNENAQIRASNGQIDPYHFWTSKSTPEKILAGLSMFIGGFQHGGVLGALNPQPMFDAMNQDIQQQVAGFQRHEKTAGLYGQLVKTLQDQGIDQENAHKIALSNVKEQAAAQIDQMVNQYAPQTLQAGLKAEIAKNGLSVPQAQAETQLNKARASESFANANKTNFEIQQAKRVADILSGISGGNNPGTISPVQEALLNKQGIGVLRDPETGNVGVTTKDNADTANKSLPKLTDAINKVQDFIDERKKGFAFPHGTGLLPDTEARRNLEQKRSAALEALDGLNGLEGASNRITGEGLDLLKDQLGGANDFTAPAAATQTVNALKQEQRDTWMRATGDNNGIKAKPWHQSKT